MAKTYQGTHGESLCAPIELRESEGGPVLDGCLIQEGRVASVRPEVFAPLSLVWSATGIALRAEHLGAEDSRAIPTREANGEIRIAAPASRPSLPRLTKVGVFLASSFIPSRKPEARLACGKFNPLSFPARRSLQSQNTNRQPPKSAPVVAENTGYDGPF